MKAITCAMAVVAVVSALTARPAAAQPVWAPAATAAIHPGVQTVSPIGQCTANFIFYNAGHVYIGQAAHCTSTSSSTTTNGCEAGSLPLGTEVEVGGASQPGTMVYNSWLTMQAIGETDADICAFNDLALVEIAAADVAKVNPSIPVWGGPKGIGPAVPAGQQVYSYGNSGLRGGVTQLSPKTGVSVGPDGNGWSTTVYAVTPGIPGDSGSPYLDRMGRAFGVVSTIAVAPLAASNGVGSVGFELGYLNAHTSLGVTLANGTQPFNPSANGVLLSILAGQ